MYVCVVYVYMCVLCVCMLYVCMCVCANVYVYGSVSEVMCVNRFIYVCMCMQCFWSTILPDAVLLTLGFVKSWRPS